MPARRLVLATLLPLALLTACGTSPSPTTPSTPTTPTLSISPTTLSLNAGDAPATFSAVVQNSSETITWVYSGPGTVSPTTGPATSFTPPASISSVQSGNLTAYLGSSGVQAVAAITVYPADQTPAPTPEPNPTPDPDPTPTPSLSVSIAGINPVTLGMDGTATVNVSASTQNASGGTTYAWTAQGDNAGMVSFGSTASEDTTVTFAGKGTYTLKLTVKSGSQTASDTVSVVVNPAPQNVTGTWNGSYTYRGVTYSLILKLEQTGTNVTGTVTAEGLAFPTSGTFDGTNLALVLTTGGEDATIEATVAGDEMTGSLKGGGEVAPMKATRQPAP